MEDVGRTAGGKGKSELIPLLLPSHLGHRASMASCLCPHWAAFACDSIQLLITVSSSWTAGLQEVMSSNLAKLPSCILLICSVKLPSVLPNSPLHAPPDSCQEGVSKDAMERGPCLVHRSKAVFPFLFHSSFVFLSHFIIFMMKFLPIFCQIKKYIGLLLKHCWTLDVSYELFNFISYWLHIQEY